MYYNQCTYQFLSFLFLYCVTDTTFVAERCSCSGYVDEIMEGGVWGKDGKGQILDYQFI